MSTCVPKVGKTADGGRSCKLDVDKLLGFDLDQLVRMHCRQVRVVTSAFRPYSFGLSKKRQITPPLSRYMLDTNRAGQLSFTTLLFTN